MIGYRIEYLASGSKEWEIYKPLRRNQGIGAVFDTLKWFSETTSHEVIKRYFWKTYKIDIDRLPSWQRLTTVYESNQNSPTM